MRWRAAAGLKLKMFVLPGNSYSSFFRRRGTVLCAITGAGLILWACGLPAAQADGTNRVLPHWAFQPVSNPVPPAVRDRAWARTDVDLFILSKLAEHGLQPAPPAGKRTLIRRATIDLTGLPPTPQEVDDFLADDSPRAFSSVVERLLASPRYGERWGRHWLDVARYADSNGMDENLAYGSAWRYRDYVVSAFNRDKPFDQFIREQIAGDLLSPTGTKDDFDRLIATGFLTIGPKMLAEDDPVKMEMDIIDEQLDTTSRAFMGLTVGCGRCHDHKYDPVPTADYYAMAGLFKSTRTMENFKVVARWQERPLGTPEEIDRLTVHRQRLEAQQKRIAAMVAEANTNQLREARLKAREYLAAARAEPASGVITNRTDGLAVAFVQQWVDYLKKTKRPPEPDSEEFQKLIEDAKGPFALPKNAESYFPGTVVAELKQAREELKSLEQSVPRLPEAMSVADGVAEDLKIHKRGSHLALGDPAARGFLKSIGAPVPPPPGTNTSGRLELAEWLARPEHPLTARVMVNRVWQGHFGEGLVRSPDNFGVLGEKPSHPELLDWLARRFIESGWSVKAMHRLVMASAVYQQASATAGIMKSSSTDESQRARAEQSQNLLTPAATADPDNRWLRHFPRRRLEAEAIRDSILFVSGGLDFTMGGSLLTVSNREYVTSTANKLDPALFEKPVRSLYLPVVRSALYEVFQVFDFADPSMINGRRDQTTVAPQALFMMNSKLVTDAARRLAGTLLAESHLDDPARIDKLYRVALGRPATAPERASALSYVTRHAAHIPVDAKKPGEFRLKSWQSLARIVMAANESVYLE